jgi:hypothetical protein
MQQQRELAADEILDQLFSAPSDDAVENQEQVVSNLLDSLLGASPEPQAQFSPTSRHFGSTTEGRLVDMQVDKLSTCISRRTKNKDKCSQCLAGCDSECGKARVSRNCRGAGDNKGGAVAALAGEAAAFVQRKEVS